MKLTFEQAEEIRDLYFAGGLRQAELAFAFRVTQSEVSKIINFQVNAFPVGIQAAPPKVAGCPTEWKNTVLDPDYQREDDEDDDLL